jgi:hypothetical protein
MNNYQLTVRGIGPSPELDAKGKPTREPAHNDIGQILPQLVQILESSGHTIQSADFILGQPESVLVISDDSPQLEDKAAELYTKFMTESSESFPPWTDFRRDPANQEKVDAWVSAARAQFS